MSLLCSRLSTPPLCFFIQSRLTSTASSQGQNGATFPFPKHSNPTPHEIFHLPRGASQSAIKSRYYELVRIYHPDRAASNDLSLSTSHSRFQAISDAYGVLSGNKLSRTSWGVDTPYEEELLRRRRAYWRASASSDEFGYGAYGGTSLWEQQRKEKWDQRLLVLIVIFALTATAIPLMVLSPFAVSIHEQKHEDARKNLANARREARQLTNLRRSAKADELEDGNATGE